MRTSQNYYTAKFAFWGFSKVHLQALVAGAFGGVLLVLGRRVPDGGFE